MRLFHAFIFLAVLAAMASSQIRAQQEQSNEQIVAEVEACVAQHLDRYQDLGAPQATCLCQKMAQYGYFSPQTWQDNHPPHLLSDEERDACIDND